MGFFVTLEYGLYMIQYQQLRIHARALSLTRFTLTPSPGVSYKVETSDDAATMMLFMREAPNQIDLIVSVYTATTDQLDHQCDSVSCETMVEIRCFDGNSQSFKERVLMDK